MAEELVFIGETITKDGPMVQTHIRRANDAITVDYFLFQPVQPKLI
jgi:hypothetical protein